MSLNSTYFASLAPRLRPGASPGGDAIELLRNSEALFVNLAHPSTRRLLKESSGGAAAGIPRSVASPR